jgi:DNA mismatch repair protein MutS
LIADTQAEFSNRDLPQFVTKLDAEIFSVKNAGKTLFEHFNTKTLKPFGLEESPLAIQAAGALIAYLRANNNDSAEQLTRLTSYDSRSFMLLDERTFNSLEVFESTSCASLLSIIDRTATAMGGRLLRRWLRQPLLDCAEIFRRQEHLAWFRENSDKRTNLREVLSEIKDLERLSSRAKANFLSAYELRVFGKSLELIPKVKKNPQARRRSLRTTARPSARMFGNGEADRIGNCR